MIALLPIELLDNMRANSFNPGLHGRFFETPEATEIHIKIYPPVINILISSTFVISLSFFSLRDLFEWDNNR